MFKNFKKSFITFSVVMVLATSIVPGRVCTITGFCPVKEANAQGLFGGGGQGGGIMNMIMSLMMIMMMMQMVKGKQGQAALDANNNLRNSGNGGSNLNQPGIGQPGINNGRPNNTLPFPNNNNPYNNPYNYPVMPNPNNPLNGNQGPVIVIPFNQ